MLIPSLLFSRSSMYYISWDFNCATIVVRLCRAVTYDCILWKCCIYIYIYIYRHTYIHKIAESIFPLGNVWIMKLCLPPSILFLPLHPFQQTSGKWLAPKFQFTHFRGQKRWRHLYHNRLCTCSTKALPFGAQHSTLLTYLSKVYNSYFQCLLQDHQFNRGFSNKAISQWCWKANEDTLSRLTEDQPHV
jgi:hypothetical protein